MKPKAGWAKVRGSGVKSGAVWAKAKGSVIKSELDSELYSRKRTGAEREKEWLKQEIVKMLIKCKA